MFLPDEFQMKLHFKMDDSVTITESIIIIIQMSSLFKEDRKKDSDTFAYLPDISNPKYWLLMLPLLQ